MQPIYTDHPLTDVEITNIVAFLDTADSTSTSAVDVALIGGLVGFGLLIALPFFS